MLCGRFTKEREWGTHLSTGVQNNHNNRMWKHLNRDVSNNHNNRMGKHLKTGVPNNHNNRMGKHLSKCHNNIDLLNKQI